MTLKSGLTTWAVKVGKASLLWRWNMSLHDAMRTCRYKCSQSHRYMCVGPLIVEWEDGK